LATYKTYDPIITGLRGYSIVAVILYHFFHEQIPWLSGYKGVDVFFVISGYLIIGHITQGIKDSRFSLAIFYAKRVIRLFPALLIMLFAVLVLGYLYLLSEEYRSLVRYVFGSIFFYTNIISWQEINYFDANTELKPLVHMWSLGVEEQFYLLFPFLALFLARFKKPMFFYLALFTVLSMFLCMGLSTIMPAATFYLLPSRFWEIGVGGLIAVAAQEINGFKLLRSNINFNIEIGLLLILISMTFQVQGFYFFDILLPVVGAAFILLDTGGGRFGRILLDNRYLKILGLISYPLYIFHFPVIAAYAITGAPFSVEIRFIAVGALSLFAYFTYRFIEMPISLAPRKKALLLLGVLSLAAVIFCIYALLEKGLPDRIKGNVEFNVDINGFHEYKNKYTKCSLVVDANCLISQNSEVAPTIAVLGDSHADHSFPGIADALPSSNIVFFGTPSCPPLDGIMSYGYGDKYQCTHMNQRVLEYVASEKNIKVVILAFAMPFYYADKGVAFQHLGPNEPILWNVDAIEHRSNRFDMVSQSLQRTVEKLLKEGKQVVLMLDAPELPFMPAHCIDRGKNLQSQVCFVRLDSYMKRQESMRNFIQTNLIGKNGFWLYDPMDVFCEDSKCHMQKGDRFLYRDSNHLSIYGSDQVGMSLASFMRNRKLVQ